MSRLKEVLKTHGIKQRDLAAAIGTTESTVSRIVNGEQGMDVEVAGEIADALQKLTGRPWMVDELIRRREGAAA